MGERRVISVSRTPSLFGGWHHFSISAIKQSFKTKFGNLFFFQIIIFFKDDKFNTMFGLTMFWLASFLHESRDNGTNRIRTEHTRPFVSTEISRKHHLIVTVLSSVSLQSTLCSKKK